MKTLVTGSMGFVGGELTRSLINEGRDVTALVREGRKLETMERFPGIREVVTLVDLVESPGARIFETIFHLATVYKYDISTADIPQMIEGNITLPSTLVDVAVSWGTPVTFVNVSTFMQHFQGAEYFPTCFYAATKKSLENILIYYTKAFKNFKSINLVFPHIYGESDTRDKILNLLIKSAGTSNRLQLASGRQFLDLVHVSDAVAALKLAEVQETGRWSIGNDLIPTIRELVELINNQSDKSLSTSFDTAKDRPFDTFQIWETAPRLPGWACTVDLQQWILNQLKNRKEE